jgi:23S rRNA pseudouridine1911/1915/1917 synthase
MASRTFVVTRADARRTVAEFLHRHLGLAWADARQLVKDGHVRVNDQPCRDSTFRLQRGQRLSAEVSGQSKPATRGKKKGAAGARKPVGRQEGVDPRSPRVVVRYSDDQVVVVEKPAGLTTMRHAHEAAEFGDRGKRFLPKTLEDLLPGLLAAGKGKPPRVIAVHRLDKETSGLVVFARTPAAAKHLGGQLRTHSADRHYLTVVRGRARDSTIESWLVRDRGDGRRGSGDAGEGQRAVTHVRVVEKLGDFTLVECRLETGRTHQVRIHLGEAGTPLCGERVYDRPVNGSPAPDTSGAKRVALHAASLGFEHPASGKRLHWTSALPADLRELVDRLRQAGRSKPHPPAENEP